MQQETNTKTTPAKFFREVKQEVSKVNWPTRRETMISTAMVVVLVIVAAIFFLGVDAIIAWGIENILRLGS